MPPPIVAARPSYRHGFYIYDSPTTDVDFRFDVRGQPMPGQGAYGGPPAQGGPPAGQPMDDDDRDDGEPEGPPMDISQFKVHGGYEQVGGFGQDSFLPPPPPPPQTGDAPHMEFADVANLKEEECREALLALIAENCCWGKKAAEGMELNKIIGSTALHYNLETYCESRGTSYESEPYTGMPIDGPENGPPPPPWAVNVTSEQMFKNHTKKVEVPHTAVVKDCHRCGASGTVICGRCNGRGNNRCGSCGGDGRKSAYDSKNKRHYQKRCNWCHGSGRKRCIRCGGDGKVTCPTCKGYRQLKCYIVLTVKFTNHTEDFIMEETDLPDELVRIVGGNSVFEQTLPQVWPIMAYPTKTINDNSIRLVEKHKKAFPTERQLQQRQTLRAIPVTECDYKWKETDRRFWVYGLDRKVHAPDYPQQCCWGCEIL